MEILQWLLGGGGLIAILSLPYTIKKIRSEAEGEIESRWKALNDEMQDEIADLRQRVAANEKDIADLREAVMTAYGCKLIRENSECPVLSKYNENKK